MTPLAVGMYLLLLFVEGLAVVFAELEKENFSGIGVSCGGGMCNIALAFMSIPVMTFSVNKAGDYIDLRAEMDLIVAISNCPQELNPCNGFAPTDMKVVVYDR